VRETEREGKEPRLTELGTRRGVATEERRRRSTNQIGKKLFASRVIMVFVTPDCDNAASRQRDKDFLVTLRRRCRCLEPWMSSIGSTPDATACPFHAAMTRQPELARICKRRHGEAGAKFPRARAVDECAVGVHVARNLVARHTEEGGTRGRIA